MNWNDREWVDGKKALAVVKSLKESKSGLAITSEGRAVEIYKMERDPILKERLPTFCWLVRCRDNMSAIRFRDKLRSVAYSF